MTSETILTIIKWGPLGFLLLAFLFGMLVGVIKGRRKALRRSIYVFLFLLVAFIVTPMITQSAMVVEIKGVTVLEYVENAVKNNEEINNIFVAIPALKDVLLSYPQAIFSLVLFLVMAWIVLPLSFPIYWIYLIIYSSIEKHVFKYSKYKLDEDGNILRDEKGKKIKDKKKKHRFVGSLMMGTQYAILASVIFVPVGVVTRLYRDGKNASVKKDLSSIKYLENFNEIFIYIDAFNDSFIGKLTNSGLNEAVANGLTPVIVEGEKTTMETELSKVVIAAVYLQECGLIETLSSGEDINTLDLTKLDLTKLDKVINLIFESKTLNALVGDGVNYVLETVLKDTLVSFTEDENIISKIKYENSSEVKAELLKVTDTLRTLINAQLLENYQNNKDNLVAVVNEVSTSDVETLLNKILSIKILSKSMPGVVSKLLKDYGLTNQLSEENNSEVVKLVVDVVKFVKSLEITNITDVTEGNVLDNVTGILYKDGVIKENSKQSLATFLSDISSSIMFNEVLVTQLNKLLSDVEINLNSQMLVNLKTKQDWLNEFVVLEDIFELYDEYKTEEKVDFLKASELLSNLKETKAMILALPVAYKTLFPELGIEVDLEKIQFIDYSQPDADAQELAFYTYWKQQLTHIEVMSQEFAKLNITSIADISLDLLDLNTNVVSLSKILEEVFTADLFKDSVTNILDETLTDLVSEFGFNLNENAVSNVNNTLVSVPYYITMEEDELDVRFNDNKYYVNNVEVTVVDNNVTYNGNEYQLHKNTLSRVWYGEIDNLASIVKVIKTADFENKENLTIVFDAIEDMKLLDGAREDLLLYAVESIGVLPQADFEAIDKDAVDYSEEKEILLNVVDKMDLVKDLSDLDFATITDNQISDLSFVLENVLSSKIFGNYAANMIIDLSTNVGVTLDKQTVINANTWENDLKLIRSATTLSVDSFNRDTLEPLLDGLEVSDLLKDVKVDMLLDAVETAAVLPQADFEAIDKDAVDYSEEKEILLNVVDKIDIVKDLSELNFATMTDNQITDLSYILNNVLQSKIFGDYTATIIVDAAQNVGANINKQTVVNANTWENDLKLIRTATNLNSDTFVRNTIEPLLNGMESSSLLKDVKNDVLLETVRKLNIDGLTIPSSLTGEQLNYTDEKNAILAASDNLDLLTSISKQEMNLSTVDSNQVSELLLKTIKSQIFSNTVVSSLVEVFNDNSIRHDFDLTGNGNLENTIKSISTKEMWKQEIDLIQGLLVVDTKEEVTSTLFTNIEESVLLGGCKANLLLRMLKEISIKQPDLKLNVNLKVEDLTQDSYAQYEVEKKVLLDLSNLEGISNLEDITESNKGEMADMLNNLSDSTVFTKSYSDLVSKIVTSMSENSELISWGVTVNSNPQVTDWNDELTALLTIKDSVSKINSMTLQTANVELVGETLDQMDISKIVDGSEAAANVIATKISGTSTTISKVGYNSWIEAFDARF